MESGPGQSILPAQEVRALPIYRRRQEFRQLYHQSQVVIVAGEPGSGKTTQIPQMVLFDELDSGKLVVSVQPGIPSTFLAVGRVAAQLNQDVGHQVSYNVPGDDQTSIETLLEFTTAEKLLCKAQKHSMLDEYSCIIIDEADQRTKASDMLIMLLKDLLAFRFDLKVVIICSGSTVGPIEQYFTRNEISVSTMMIDSYLQPALVRYAPELKSQDLSGVVNLILEIEQTENQMHVDLPPVGPGDILVVLATVKEVKLLCYLLESQPTAVEVIPIHEDLSPSEWRRAFMPCSRRKCIISTELIKSSFSTDGVSYVIDSGSVATKTFHEGAGMEGVSIDAITKKNANRRAARAPLGVCFRLYSEATYHGAELERPAELLRTSIASDLLLLKTMGYRNISDADLLDRPCPTLVASGTRELESLDLLDYDRWLNRHGDLARRCMTSDTPISPAWYKAIIEGYLHGVSEEMFSLAAIFNSPRNIFIDPNEPSFSARRIRAPFLSDSSDHLVRLRALYEYERVVEEMPHLIEPFCSEYSLDQFALEAVVRFRDQLPELFDNFFVEALAQPRPRQDLREESVRMALAKSFPHHVALLVDPDSRAYKIRGSECIATIISDSCLATVRPACVVFDTLNLVNGPQLECVTAIEPDWLPIDPTFLKEKRAFYRNEKVYVDKIDKDDLLRSVLVRCTKRSDRN